MSDEREPRPDETQTPSGPPAPPSDEDLERTQAYETFWQEGEAEDDDAWPFKAKEIEAADPGDELPSLEEITFEPRSEPPPAVEPPPPAAEAPPWEHTAPQPAPGPTVPIPGARRPAAPDAGTIPVEPTAEPSEPTPAEAAPEPEPHVHVPEPRALSKRRMRTLALFAEAMIPEGGAIPLSAQDVGVAERIDAVLSGLEPAARRTPERMLTAWEWAPLPTRFRKFSRLSAKERASFVEQSPRARSPLRRHAFDVLKTYCLNQWASSPGVEEAIGYDYSCVSSDPPRDAPPLEVLSWPQVDRDHVEECDAVVIGSGAGGAVVAKELAEVGLSVIVLEEGPYFTRKDFAGPPWERFLKMYRAGGTTAAVGSPAIPMPLGRAVGGTTVVGSGTCFRTPDRVLRDWGTQMGLEGVDAEGMAPFFERVERILRVKPVPEELLGPNARAFRRGVERLGLHGGPVLRSIEGCRGCGTCAFGCPSDAKQSTDLSYLPRAQRAGAAIYASARADQLIVEEGRARGVVALLLDGRTGEPRATLTVRAKVVVVACGAVHTPVLLAANALGGRSGQLGRNLRIHPAAGVGAFFDQPIHNWRGTLQSYYVDDFLETDDLMIEVTNSVPSIGAGRFPGAGTFVKELVAQYPNIAMSELFVSDRSSGRVIPRRGGEPLIVYRLGKADTVRLVRGIAKVAEIFLAAGARTVMTGLPKTPLVGSKGDLDLVKEEAVRPGVLKLTGFHPVGTARMGSDPERSVVDQWGMVHGVHGVFVADASVLPGCPAINPMVTIMAFATRTADHLVRHGARYF